MPYIVVAVALYFLYKHFSAQSQPAAVVNLDNTPDGPSSVPSDNGGGGDQPPAPDPSPAPSPAAPTVTWKQIPEGQQLTPGADYRASAPPQNALVMALIPSHLASAGFTNVVIYKPGDAFPNDWPDSGNALRIAATLPASAQAQTLNLDGVSVWQNVATDSVSGVLRNVVGRVAHVAPTQVVQAARTMPHPTNNGVYAGLVRRR
jgi:hypothetical protein